MISVDEALTHLFALVDTLDTELVPLQHAAGRILAKDVAATRNQPPFAASAMDGYAVDAGDVYIGQTFTTIGEAAAGHQWQGTVRAGETLRIFTGAPLPAGTNHVIIQENTQREGDKATITSGPNDPSYVRPAGGDFKIGDTMAAPRIISAADVALLAAMNIGQVPVTRKPVIAIIATGDELVQPGEDPRPDQIIASNSYGLAALIAQHGGTARLLPIARDTAPALEQAFDLATDADLIVTIGGASVGDHDLVGTVAHAKGLDRAFYKIAMRPGKPLMAGKIGKSAMIGLPGNPVSSMVCGHIFLVPMLNKMRGLGAHPAKTQTATLAAPVGPNANRQHYMRARHDNGQVTVFDRQDSALLTVLADANCLAVRPIADPARQTGDDIDIVLI